MGGNNYESTNNSGCSESEPNQCGISGRSTGRSQTVAGSSMPGSGCCGGKPASECCITVDSLQVAANRTPLSAMTHQEWQDAMEKHESCIDDLLDAFTAAIRDYLEASKAHPDYETAGPLTLENIADSLVDNFLTTMNLLTAMKANEQTG